MIWNQSLDTEHAEVTKDMWITMFLKLNEHGKRWRNLQTIN